MLVNSSTIASRGAKRSRRQKTRLLTCAMLRSVVNGRPRQGPCRDRAQPSASIPFRQFETSTHPLCSSQHLSPTFAPNSHCSRFRIRSKTTALRRKCWSQMGILNLALLYRSAALQEKNRMRWIGSRCQSTTCSWSSEQTLMRSTFRCTHQIGSHQKVNSVRLWVNYAHRYKIFDLF